MLHTDSTFGFGVKNKPGLCGQSRSTSGVPLHEENVPVEEINQNLFLIGEVWGSGKTEFGRLKCRLAQLCSSVISALKDGWLLIYSSLPGSPSFH